MKKHEITITLSVLADLSPAELKKAVSDASQSAQRALLSAYGGEGRYVRSASPSGPDATP